MARTGTGRGIGFFLIVIIVVYGAFSAAVALSTGRKCSDRGEDRQWEFVPPHWECKSQNPFVNVN